MGFLKIMILWLALVATFDTIDGALLNYLYYRKVNIDVLLKDRQDKKTIIPWRWCIVAICFWCIFFGLHFKISELFF